MAVRVLGLGLLLVAIGCQAPAQRPAVAPLPEDSSPQPFAELITRARQQAMTALEAYYVDRWPEVEEAARGLEQTARFLRRSTGVPPTRQGDLSLKSDTLAEAAKQLRDAARLRAGDQVNSVLQRINAQVRELR
jgi:hypothetical protein